MATANSRNTATTITIAIVVVASGLVMLLTVASPLWLELLLGMLPKILPINPSAPSTMIAIAQPWLVLKKRLNASKLKVNGFEVYVGLFESLLFMCFIVSDLGLLNEY